MGSVSWTFHSEQWRVWQSKARTRVVVWGRRAGKSELGARWMLAGARDDHLRGKGGVSWVVLPTYKVARPIWRKFLATAPDGWITNTVGTERMPDVIEVGTSRIEFKSAEHPEHLVGEGLRRLWPDECADMREAVWTESLLPTLIDHSAPALLTGTPGGRDWFFRMFRRGLDPLDPEVESFHGPTTINPFVSVEEVERTRQELPARLFRQEILAEFLDDEGAVFRNVRECVMPGGKLAPGPAVAFGIDLARKLDYTVLVGINAARRVCVFERFHNVPWGAQKDRIASAVRKASGEARPRVIVDASGVGDPVVEDLRRAGLRIDGLVFTSQNKVQVMDGLAVALEQGLVGLPDEPVLLNELEAFEFTQTKHGAYRYAAPEGLHDDCVCALALAWRATHRAGDTGVTIGEQEPTRATGEHPDGFEPFDVAENQEYMSNPELWT